MRLFVPFALFVFIAVFAQDTQSPDPNDPSILELKKAEGELLQVFQEVITEIKQKHADDPHKDDWVKQMKLAQEAWARFVEADQMAAAFYWRKAGTDKAQTEWKRMLTKQRILNLRKRYNARK